MIPFVFDTLLELCESHPIAEIRLPREPFFLCCKSASDIRNYVGLNIVKHLLLNILSRAHEPRLDALQIGHCSHFVGVLFTGRMHEAAVRKALTKIPASNPEETVEILFHPGIALPEEQPLLNPREGFLRHHYSPLRRSEQATVMSNSFRELTESIGG